MKNIIKYLFITVVTFILSINSINAAAPGSITITRKDDGPSTSIYNQSLPSTANYKVTDKGKVVYCADHAMEGLTCSTWNLNNGTAYLTNRNPKMAKNGTQSAINAVCYYGHGGGGNMLTDWNNYDAYMITNMAMWYFINNSDITVTPAIQEGYNSYATDANKGGDGRYGKTNPVYTKATGATGKLIYEATQHSGNVFGETTTGGIVDDTSVSITPSSSVMTLDKEGKYYVAKIQVTNVKSDSGQATLTLSGSKDAFMTFEEDKTTGFIAGNAENNAYVYVKIPFDKADDKLTLSVKATVSKTSSKTTTKTLVDAYVYTSSNENGPCQPVIYCDERPESTPEKKTFTKEASATMSLHVTKIKVNKTDMSGTKELKGAKLIITKKDSKDFKNECISSGDKNKPCEFDLGPGTYILTEEKAPEGYIKSSENIEFTIKDDGTVEKSEYTMKNAPIIIKVLKVDEENNNLAGAKLKITSVKDEKMEKDLTGKSLTWESTTTEESFHLPAGEYILIEISAPEGYEKAEEGIKFTINDKGEVIIDKETSDSNIVIIGNEKIPEQVKTGSKLVYIIIGAVLSIGIVLYVLFKKKVI